MSADIVRRLMDSAEDANDDIASKSFHRTISSDTSPESAASRIDSLTNNNAGSSPQSGADIFASLTARAQKEMRTTKVISNDPRLSNYSASTVGSTGKDKELRRELTMRQREERIAREERFRPEQPKDRKDRRRELGDRGSKRQEFNATSDSSQGTQADLSSRIVFREPPSRGYDPFNHQ